MSDFSSQLEVIQYLADGGIVQNLDNRLYAYKFFNGELCFIRLYNLMIKPEAAVNINFIQYQKFIKLALKEWWETLPEHGVLCEVQDFYNENTDIQLITGINKIGKFIGVGGVSWDIAKPLTKLAVEKYIWNGRYDARV